MTCRSEGAGQEEPPRDDRRAEVDVDPASQDPHPPAGRVPRRAAPASSRRIRPPGRLGRGDRPGPRLGPDVRAVRAVRQGAAGVGLVALCRGARPRRGCRPRPAACPRRGLAPQASGPARHPRRPGLRRHRRCRCPDLLLLRGADAVGRGGPAAGVPRSGPARRAGVGPNPDRPRPPDPPRLRRVHGRPGAGARHRRRRRRRPDRRALGAGRRRLPVRVLPAVGEGLR